MQAWYWDYPKTTEDANWADSLGFKAETLKNAGFTYLWLPPLTRASSGNGSNGYDPKDLYDYGEFGGGATGFGTRNDLDNLVEKLNDNGINIIADLVYNHRDGGEMENNPGVKAYVADFDWDKANGGANPFPYDRMRVILPIGGSTGIGEGDYYFKIRSSSQHSNYHFWEYKFYAQTTKVGWQDEDDDEEVEPNGGGNCAEANNELRLGVNMNAQIDDDDCGVDEFHVNLSASDFNADGDTLALYFGNRNSGYSDAKIIGIWYDGGTGSDIVSNIEYQTYTDFSDMPSGQGNMNWTNFKPNLDNATSLEGDWDDMTFFYDYDQFQDDTKDKLIEWTKWNWNDVGVRGLRMDAVKHFTPSYIGDMLDNLHDNSMDPPIVVGEVYDSNPETLANWVNEVFANMDEDTKNSISPRVFDFSTRTELRKACDETSTSDTRNIFANSVVDSEGLSGFNVVTFINNHDFRDESGYASLIQSDAILAYTYILTNNQIGVPMVFYPDYFGYPDDDEKYPYFPSDKSALSDEIDKLMIINKEYISGSSSRDYLNRYSTSYSSSFTSGSAYQSLIYQISGGDGGKEVIVAINFSSEQLQVDHEIALNNGLAEGSQLYDIIGNSANPYAVVNSSNQIYIDLPARSWSVWVQGPVTPLSPGKLTLKAVSSDKISVAWKDNSVNEDNFVVERKSGADGSWAEIATLDENISSYDDNSSFSSSIDYYYRVKASNNDGSSSYSNEVFSKPYVLWQGYSDDWNNQINWSPRIIPNSNCDIKIPSSSVGGNTLNSNSIEEETITIKSLELGNDVIFTVPAGKTIIINQ